MYNPRHLKDFCAFTPHTMPESTMFMSSVFASLRACIPKHCEDVILKSIIQILTKLTALVHFGTELNAS